jgi:post-segregation antitoxin (ccd killing protein)
MGDGIRVTTKNIQVGIGCFWDYLKVEVRAETLNDSRAVDVGIDNYLELALRLRNWCQLSWRELPAWARKSLNSQFGLAGSGAAEYRQAKAAMNRVARKMAGAKRRKRK